ncbi:ABC transporter substrate-binding protein [Aquamicrobium zhengzhouense]|uniref:ABC transporter substrate-binding protein n=1 Tax=Aquamicrobium zhengzhouense TaxID=2781738 RepID=A0ABS0SEH2_9HYPH|nr:ABC transporter substrate-binding protein [Aquamicrobium zhengzhouense]MBI1621702.1 ABC transporter substrate-binding protein [Aquamicrobium zhengzhouense]
MKTVFKAALAAASMIVSAQVAYALDKVTVGTNWLAQAGHGGFYQALADGTYEKHGLDVTIDMGGPQVNNRPMLAAGRLDFLLTGNLLLTFNNVANDVPTTVVAAFYQKDPQVLMAHEGAYKDFQDLTNAPAILLAKDGQFSYWLWLVKEFGFRDEQIRPYGYSLAQFLSDEKMVQQAYATAEPLYAAKEGAKPVSYLLADYGYNTYANTVETRTELIEKNPDLVQRFVDATIIGWYNFLYGDRSAAYELILKDNPDMKAETLDAELARIMELDLIDSGEAAENGIGAISMERVKDFYDLAVASGIVEKADLDLSKVATDQFVNKGVGIDVKKQLKP